MPLYQRYLLPRLINFAMSSSEATRLREKVIPTARGVVLEIGVGSGLNFPFYGSAVTKMYGVDPSAELLAMARPKTERLLFPVELLRQEANRLPLGDRSIDTAVVTWSLCSIGDPVAALGEVWRVLKPGGALIFVEHGLAPDAGVRKWQNRLTPVWCHLAGGCHLNRKVDDLIREAGFEMLQISADYVPGPRVGSYMYSGHAQKVESKK